MGFVVGIQYNSNIGHVSAYEMSLVRLVRWHAHFLFEYVVDT